MQTEHAPTTPKLLISPKAASELLSISPRTLWTLTAPRGPIPSLRLGRLVRYRPEALAEWLVAQETEVRRGL